jgi:hypothetical protein
MSIINPFKVITNIIKTQEVVLGINFIILICFALKYVWVDYFGHMTYDYRSKIDSCG